MDQLQQFKRAGNKKKRTQGNKINEGVSKVATNLGSLQISPAVPTIAINQSLANNSD